MTPEQEQVLLDELLAIRAVLVRLEQLMDKIALGLGVTP